jgi:hypothetical protein
MQRLLVAILLATMCGAAGAAEIPAACSQSIVPARLRTPVKDFSDELPIPDYLDTIIACNTPRFGAGNPPQVPSAAWLGCKVF